MSTIDRPTRLHRLPTDFAADFERPGAFEKAAVSFQGTACGVRANVIERIHSESYTCGNLELPRVRLVLALEVDCTEDDPDVSDADVLRALRDYCERVHRRLGDRREPPLSDTDPIETF
jgi:hypothetical protein